MERPGKRYVLREEKDTGGGVLRLGQGDPEHRATNPVSVPYPMAPTFKRESQRFLERDSDALRPWSRAGWEQGLEAHAHCPPSCEIRFGAWNCRLVVIHRSRLPPKVKGCIKSAGQRPVFARGVRDEERSPSRIHLDCYRLANFGSPER